MRWNAFAEACPQIASMAEERLRTDEVVMLGTIRPNGRPRLSPCELDFAADRLCFGMMWQSRKALDLLRDPRLVVHSVPIGRMNSGGDIKLAGLAVEERAPVVRDLYTAVLRRRIDWVPDEPFHVFSLDVQEAAVLRFGDNAADRLAFRWDETNGFRTLRHPDDPS